MTITTLREPAEFAGAISHGLAAQQQEREKSILSLRRLRKEASAEIHRLIAFLDASDPYVQTELEEENEREEVGDDEPSLGSFDRMVDQTKSYRLGSFDVDAEQDDCDREDADPDEAQYQPLDMGGAA